MSSNIVEKIKELIRKALDLLDYVVGILRVKLAFLKSWSPTFAGKKWIYINGICCMTTAMFFLISWLPEDTIGFKVAKRCYIPYNMIICLIWFAEASLWLLFDEETEAWHKLGELLLAVFFVIDGILFIYEWLFLDVPLEARDVLLYTAIDFLIYLFYLVLAIRAEAKQASREADACREKTAQGMIDQDIIPPSQEKEAETDFKLLT